MLTELTIQDLITRSGIREVSQSEAFSILYREAIVTANQTWLDRAQSYNVGAPATDEMCYGVVSLASEIFKRAKRMSSLLTPLRREPLRPVDVERGIDSCIDLINYAAWQYALLRIATSEQERRET